MTKGRLSTLGDASADDRPHPLPAGHRLDEFELLEVIGDGGFGIVYRAYDHSLQREVAIKEYMPAMLARRVGDNSVHVRSARRQGTFQAGLRGFINEARTLAQFNHPALLRVHRFWEANATAYMATQLYSGWTLRRVLEDAATPPSEASLRSILGPLLGALDMLHADGCFHRDIAPDNIFIQHDGAPVLLDFGAARKSIADIVDEVAVMVKSGYSPIEQYADDSALRQGAWTDLYALGAVLYRAATGAAPPSAVVRSVEDNHIPLTALGRTDLSTEFCAAVDAALAVNVKDRTQTVAAFAQSLDMTRLGDVYVGRREALAAMRGAAVAGGTTEPVADDARVAPAEAVEPVPPQPTEPPVADPTPWTAADRIPLPAPPSDATPPDAAPRIPPPAVAAARVASVQRAPRTGDRRKAAIGGLLAIVVVLVGWMGWRQWGGDDTADRAAPPAATTPPPVASAPAASAAAQPPLPTTPARPEPAQPSGATTPSVDPTATAPAIASTPETASTSGTEPTATPPTPEATAAATPISEAQATSGAGDTTTSTAASATAPGMPASTVTSVEVGGGEQTEAQRWQQAQAENTPQAYEAYLRAHRRGPHAREARASLAELHRQARAAEARSGTASGSRPEAAGALGRVVLNVRPWGQIYVNGVDRGVSPPVKTLSLPPGTYTIEVRNGDLPPYRRRVTIGEGQGVPVISYEFK